MYDCYVKEFEAKVEEVKGNEVILDRTAFSPRAGGVDSDRGIILYKGEEYKVLDVRKEGNKIIHVLDRNPNFKEGDFVKGIIDWERRYKLMRLHTAAHIISGILYSKYKVLVTGGEIKYEYARDDFNINFQNWKEILKEVVEEANKIIKEGREVKIYFLPREEAFKIPGIVKLANKLPPKVDKIRIVEIEGIDIQADGGVHVKNTKEIGEIEIIKLESRGKNRKRIYYTVKP